VNWGDGTSSQGSVTGSDGKFRIIAAHAYLKTMNYPLSVTVSEIGGEVATVIGKALPATATMVMSPSSGAASTLVTLKGAHLAPYENVTVRYKTLRTTSPKTVVLCTTTVAANGRWSCTANVPPAATAGPLGKHPVTATGTASGQVATTTFTLTT
jgi:hypothetical protein